LKIAGIICEYNPFHLGHKKQIDLLKQDRDTAVVCLMSGNFVQRGAPAIVDKQLRAKAAVQCGADLVLELPVTTALQSAEGFAAGGVSILSRLCTHLCFGAETGDKDILMDIAQALLSADFTLALRTKLDAGLSFPAARQQALEEMGLPGSVLQQPNNILAVEYCKAIISQNAHMEILPIIREGGYHDLLADQENPSATAVRQLMLTGDNWEHFVPETAAKCFCCTQLHTLHAGERAILGQLRRMEDADFEAIPYGSEGLWRKLMHAARSKSSLEDILTETKSKRYTRSRLDRMVMCAFLGITQDILSTPAPYVRILAFNDTGRQILKNAKNSGYFINIGQSVPHSYQRLEERWGSLYGLFARDCAEAPDCEKNYRVYVEK